MSWTYYEPVVGSTRVGMHRSVSYYEQLLDLGCKFLPPSYDLKLQAQINSWYIPVSITGSICIESSLSGLSSIYTGHPLFKGLPGTYSMDEILDFSAFSAQIQAPGQFSQDAVLTHLSNRLNFTTIVNILGVGNGKPLNEDALVADFNAEYTNLINSLL